MHRGERQREEEDDQATSLSGATMQDLLSLDEPATPKAQQEEEASSNSYNWHAQLRLSLLMCHEDDAIMHEVAIMHEP